jgi:hypothetical protein
VATKLANPECRSKCEIATADEVIE